MGYIKKGSTASLVASTAVSLLLFVSASLMGRPDQRIGSLLALGEGGGGAVVLWVPLGMRDAPSTRPTCLLLPLMIGCAAHITGTCLALAALMGKRYKSSKKVFPAGILTVLSGAMAAGHIKTLL